MKVKKTYDQPVIETLRMKPKAKNGNNKYLNVYVLLTTTFRQKK